MNAKINPITALAVTAAGHKSDAARERAAAVAAFDAMVATRPLRPPPLPAEAPRTRTPGQIEAERIRAAEVRPEVHQLARNNSDFG